MGCGNGAGISRVVLPRGENYGNARSMHMFVRGGRSDACRTTCAVCSCGTDSGGHLRRACACEISSGADRGVMGLLGRKQKLIRFHVLHFPRACHSFDVEHHTAKRFPINEESRITIPFKTLNANQNFNFKSSVWLPLFSLV